MWFVFMKDRYILARRKYNTSDVHMEDVMHAFNQLVDTEVQRNTIVVEGIQ